MPPEPQQTTPTRSDAAVTPPIPVTPVATLDDPRALTILSTEHWSLLSARSLSYNEAFTRGGMFITFLSASLVAIALLAQGMGFGDEFLPIAAIVLTFDLVIGLTTYARIGGANSDDLRAVHGMARIRHGYTQIAPITTPYFTTPTHDDLASVITTYGPTGTAIGEFLYPITTSLGMIGLITAMIGGVLAGILGLIAGVSGGVALWIGLGGFVVVFVALVVPTLVAVARHQAQLGVLFPAERGSSDEQS